MSVVIQRIADWKRAAAGIPSGAIVGLVPTMGALHQGHGALLEEARRRCTVVVASIFVNPLQFDQRSDYDLYPRALLDDAAFCAVRGADYIFAPASAEMYPEPQRVFVEVEGLTDYLCGGNRPGHFRGVSTVVLKLFEILQPDLAFFGEKDYQQLAVVRRLVRDLNVPVEVVGVPTVRERDGLAMSSRNRRLRPTERLLAPGLYKALVATRESIAGGERNAAVITEMATRDLRRTAELRVEYFDLVDPDTIQPVEMVMAPVRAAGAVWIGKTRLIDNVLCEPPKRS